MTNDDNLTRDEATVRAGIISTVEYDVALVVSGDRRREASGAWTPLDETFSSVTVVRFHAAEASTFIDCDARSIGEITLNGRPMDPATVEGTRIPLTGLDTTPGAVNELRIAAAMEYSADGIGMHRMIDQVDGRVYMYTNSEPFDAHRWFACFDQPDIKGAVKLSVTTPVGWHAPSCYPAAAPWAITETTQSIEFERTRPIPPYVMAVCPGEWHHEGRRTAEGIDCAFYCRRSLADDFDVDNIFRTTENGLALFPGLYGVQLPCPKYDQVFVPECNAGAMENLGCVTHGDQYSIFRSRPTRADHADRANAILHEMAHMWFGDLVTMRWWDDLWLNESFATFMANLAKVMTGEYTDAWVDFANADKAWALQADQLPSTHPIAADAPDVRTAELNFDGITYAKGASVLRQLVAYVGQEKLLAAIKTYMQRFGGGNATLADFLGCLEHESGRNLTDWSNRWLRTTGVSRLTPLVVPTADGSQYRSVAIRQDPSTDGTLRAHRMAIGCYSLVDGRLVRTGRVELDVDGEVTPVTGLTGARVPDLLLVNDDDLTFGKVAFDKNTMATLATHLGAIEDPLARTICWANAWDMTRDGGLATRDWVALVAGQSVAEAEVGVLERLLARARLSVELYGDPANRTAARTVLAAAAARGMRTSEPGSDLQLVWAQSFVQSAAQPQDLDFLRRWLDGEVTVAGIDLDAADTRDTRWSIVTRLVAAGWVGGQTPEAFIGAELQRDTGDVWRNRSLTALASRPTVAAKEEAWEQITGDGSRNLKERLALIAGFSPPDQDSLVAPFVARWAAAVPTAWRTKPYQLAEAITQGLYPRYLADESVVAAGKWVLASPGLTPGGVRVVSEQLDGTLRAQRARGVDIAAGGRHRVSGREVV